MTEHRQPLVNAPAEPHAEAAPGPLPQHGAAPAANVVVGGLGADALATSAPADLVIAASFDDAARRAAFGSDAEAPYIHVGEGTRTVTVNGPPSTVSVPWDRVVQQEVIDTEGAIKPTLGARACAGLDAAMFDAWAPSEPEAVPVAARHQAKRRRRERAAVAEPGPDPTSGPFKLRSRPARFADPSGAVVRRSGLEDRG
ncbi:MAG: hypothetical protein ACLFU0_01100 [Alphaproteobacteria bacterium]